MRLIVAVVVAALVVFLWGFVSWSALSLWGDQVRPMPEDAAVSAALMDSLPSSGAYYFPPMPDGGGSAEESAGAIERWSARHGRGPIGMVLIQREGADPMSPGIFVGGMVLNLVNALLMAAAMTAVSVRGAGFGVRLAIGICMVLFAALATHGSSWNWFYFPDDYTVAMMADTIIGWTLAAIVMAAILRTPRAGAAS